mgnify:FL=1
MSVSVWSYIKELNDKKIFTNKQRKFLSHISIYTHDLNVYKVIVNADMKKKNGKRVGVDYSMLIYEKGKDTLLKYKDGLIKEEKIFKVRGETLTFPLLKKEVEGSEKGSKIFIYDVKKDEVNVYDGELSL